MNLTDEVIELFNSSHRIYWHSRLIGKRLDCDSWAINKILNKLEENGIIKKVSPDGKIPKIYMKFENGGKK